MPRYRIPVSITFYVEKEANNLEIAESEVCTADFKKAGIDIANDKIFDWETSTSHPVSKDDEEIVHPDGNTLFLSDLADFTKY